MPEQAIFQMIGYLLKKERHKAHLALHDLLQNNAPLKVLGALRYHMKQVVALLAEKRGGAQVAVPSFVRTRYAHTLPAWSASGLAEAITLLSEMDVLLKSAPPSPEATELLFVELIEAL